jgi:hypothetical protein
MSIDSPHDPRTALVRTKYFSLHPKPLERWLWRQSLPQAAERVFWLHWEEGMRAGDWCSEIPIKRVARECAIDPSTVTRAYQLLKSLGLLKREDPGRDPANPFCQATAITEVRLPRDLLTELSASPNRPLPSGRTPDSKSSDRSIASAATRTTDRARSRSAPDASTVRLSGTSHRPSREETRALWGRASAAERARFYAASRDRMTALHFDPDTQLTPADRAQILAQLAQLAAATPPVPTPQTALRTPRPEHSGPRALSPLELARARKRILDLVPAGGSAEVLRQVIWAVEEGALRRFTPTMALNIALKKIREGAWSKPHRMPPPHWLPRSSRPDHAIPERCSAA